MYTLHKAAYHKNARSKQNKENEVIIRGNVGCYFSGMFLKSLAHKWISKQRGLQIPGKFRQAPFMTEGM